MKGFEQVWSSVARMRGGEAVLPDSRPLVLRVHNNVATSPVNLSALKNSLVELLQYLGGAQRRCGARLVFDQDHEAVQHG